MIKQDSVIKILSEDHEKAIRKRLVELGWHCRETDSAWEGYGLASVLHVYKAKNKLVTYSSFKWFQENFPNRPLITLDDLYREDKSEEIKERIKKCEEELKELRGML